MTTFYIPKGNSYKEVSLTYLKGFADFEFGDDIPQSYLQLFFRKRSKKTLEENLLLREEDKVRGSLLKAMFREMQEFVRDNREGNNTIRYVVILKHEFCKEGDKLKLSYDICLASLIPSLEAKFRDFCS